MSSKGYTPTRDGEFLAWAQNIAARCGENAQWQIPAEDMAELTALAAEAAAAYAANSNKELANKQSSTLKQRSFEALKRFISTFTAALQVNRHIPDEAIEAMGLRPRAHHFHEPLPVPQEAPDITAASGHHRSITIYAASGQKGHPSAHANKGYHGIRVRYKVEGSQQWQTQMESRLHATLYFGEEDIAKSVTITIAWLNPRLEAGPESDALTMIIT
jgi:hypothetical protein